MMNLRQLSRDMRALGEMLIAQASDLDKILNVDLSPLTALIGNIEGITGGEPAKVRPFVENPKPAGLKRNKWACPKLTREQKAQMREHYNSLPEKDRTIESRRKLAQAYGVPVQYYSIVVSRDKKLMEKVRAGRAAKQAVHSTA